MWLTLKRTWFKTRFSYRLLLLLWLVLCGVVWQQVCYLQAEIQRANKFAASQAQCAKHIEAWVAQQMQGSAKPNHLHNTQALEGNKECIARHGV